MIVLRLFRGRDKWQMSGNCVHENQGDNRVSFITEFSVINRYLLSRLFAMVSADGKQRVFVEFYRSTIDVFIASAGTTGWVGLGERILVMTAIRDPCAACQIVHWHPCVRAHLDNGTRDNETPLLVNRTLIDRRGTPGLSIINAILLDHRRAVTRKYTRHPDHGVCGDSIVPSSGCAGCILHFFFSSARERCRSAPYYIYYYRGKIKVSSLCW